MSKSKEEKVVEELKERGKELVEKLKSLIHAGNVRKVVVKNAKGKKLASFRLNIGLVGVLCAPVLLAVGALVAAVNDCTVEVIKIRSGGD